MPWRHLMARYPGAVWKPLSRNFNPGARTAQLGLILHVQAGNGELSGWFSNPAAQASSTFWVSKTGELYQYMEAGTDKSWAQAAGNSRYDSVETEGQPTEALTDAQVKALAALVRWEHEQFAMPYTVINTPGAKGFGWHGMGGAAWGGHTGCPGDIRRAQMPQILALAQQGDTIAHTTSEEDDMQIVTSTATKTQWLLTADGTLVGLPNPEYARVAQKMVSGTLQGINAREVDVLKDLARRIKEARK
jgi:hypothetical protein